ncbi:MAG: hypothetical protein REI96_22710, partial [Flavobacterium nitrogenifigens]|uniref:hypothetical protein n=1 Tax=Flavobacterium nitrogenifigens TaxID=1617283 RepID=UPI002808F791|nr:hypothetical protein [Flavobacterium nitrogenifigens]
AIGRWLNVDLLAEKFINVSPFAYVANNPINFTDPDGRDIRLGNLMSNEQHALAFMIFAMTDDGKSFLDNYASKGQEFSYNGQVFYKSTKDGKYHSKNINLNYNIGTKDKSSSTNAQLSDNGLNINVDIGKKGFGLQLSKQSSFADPLSGAENNSKTIFNLLSAISHENFLHVDSSAEDFYSDGKLDKSNLPKEYRNSGRHADHYYFSHQSLYYPNNNSANTFNGRGFNVLNQGAKALRLNVPSNEIKRVMWNFDGSRIRVNQTNGNYTYDKYGSSPDYYN